METNSYSFLFLMCILFIFGIFKYIKSKKKLNAKQVSNIIHNEIFSAYPPDANKILKAINEMKDSENKKLWKTYNEMKEADLIADLANEFNSEDFNKIAKKIKHHL